MSQSRFDSWWTGLAEGKPQVYVIAEIANAHEGSFDHAKKLVGASFTSGADAVKLQCLTADELLVPAHSMHPVFKRLELSWQEHGALIEYAKQLGMDVFCDVFGLETAQKINEFAPTGFKIHPSDISNLPLIRQVGRFGRPLLLSTGGVNWIEAAEAMDALLEVKIPLILLHGFQRYPTSIEDCSILRLKALSEKFNLPVGYADHVDGACPEAFWVPLVAIGAGARLIEKHITLDRSAKGTDYFSSLEPEEFKQFVSSVRTCEKTLGEKGLSLFPAELEYRKSVKKIAVAGQKIETNETLTEGNITFKRSENSKNDLPYASILGKKIRRNLNPNEPISYADLDLKIVATLACRANSSRLYAKPLQIVGDRPILKHLIDRLKKVSLLDQIVLAISAGEENLEFVQFAGQWKLPYVIGNEKDVLGRLIQAADSVSADIVLRITTENPFIYYENIDALIHHHLKHSADLTVCELLPNGAHVEIINLKALKRAHQFGEDRHRSELCTLFIFEHPDIFHIEKLQAPEEVARPDFRLTIDNQEDLVVARKIYEALSPQFGPVIPLAEIVKFLDEHPEVRKISAHFETLKLWR